MEANFFRLLCDELIPQLSGKRFVNIYCPTPGHWAFKLGNREFFHLCPSPKGGALFFDSSSPDNPLQPPAQAMWFRKRLKGRRIRSVEVDWPLRRMAVSFSPAGDAWLILDVRSGPALVSELPQGFASAPEWPPLNRVLDDETVWQTYPQLSPPLRNTLKHLKPDDASHLYDLVQAGRARDFSLYSKAEKPVHVLAWQLPDDLGKGFVVQAFTSASETATAYGREMVRVLRHQLDPEGNDRKQQMRRVRRNLKKIDQDEARLRKLVNLQEQAVLLQANLYRLDKQQKAETVRLTNDRGDEVDVALEPKLTVMENLTRMFRLARKGERGLAFISGRRREIQAELEMLHQGKLLARMSERQQKLRPKPSHIPARWRKLAVHVYRSSNGFLLLRGKNKKANHQLLSQAASPFDLWFHAEEGPGAHVILKRDHEGQEVDETSMHEAAVLAALASHQASDAKGRVMCALVKDVRKIKGADLGQVRVAHVKDSLVVDLDPELENRLKMNS